MELFRLIDWIPLFRKCAVTRSCSDGRPGLDDEFILARISLSWCSSSRLRSVRVANCSRSVWAASLVIGA